MIALLLFAQISAADPAARLPAPDVARLRQRVLAAEQDFFATWRDRWTSRVRGRSSADRLRAFHCHHDNSFEGKPAPNIVARVDSSRKAMCPTWHPDTASAERDEAMHGVDVALSPADRERVRAERRKLLGLLDSAAALAPADSFIAGQRVRMWIEQGDLIAAMRAARECTGHEAWCRVLTGYVHHVTGSPNRAVLEFEGAGHAMSPPARCAWEDVGILLSPPDRERYAAMTCEARRALHAGFWWLADPLWSDGIHDRQAEHYARRVRVALHAAPEKDDRLTWRRVDGGLPQEEMVIRYGWPSAFWWAGYLEDQSHFRWLGAADGSVNVAPEYFLPRAHTVPTLDAMIDTSSVTAGVWRDLAPARRRGKWDETWWPREHYARRNGPLLSTADQSAIFRRAAGALVAYAGRVDTTVLTGTRKVEIVFKTHDSMALTGTAIAADRVAATYTVGRRGLFGVEVMSSGGAASRGRFAVTPHPLSRLAPREIALSDLALFAVNESSSMPTDVASLLPMMMTTDTASSAGRIGVYWESYGVAPDDTAEIELQVTHDVRPGALRRLGARLGLADRIGGSITLRWRQLPGSVTRGLFSEAGVPVRPNAVAVDLSRLRPGPYVMELRVRRPGSGPAAARRSFTIADQR